MGWPGFSTTHEVTKASGLSRVLPRHLGEGWGCIVSVREPSLTRLGGWQTGGGCGVIPTPGGYVDVTVIL